MYRLCGYQVDPEWERVTYVKCRWANNQVNYTTTRASSTCRVAAVPFSNDGGKGGRRVRGLHSIGRDSSAIVLQNRQFNTLTCHGRGHDEE